MNENSPIQKGIFAMLFAGLMGLWATSKFGGGDDSKPVNLEASTTLSSLVLNNGVQDFSNLPKSLETAKNLSASMNNNGRTDVVTDVLGDITKKSFGTDLFAGATDFNGVVGIYSKHGAMQKFSDTKPENLNVLQGNIITANINGKDVQILLSGAVSKAENGFKLSEITEISKVKLNNPLVSLGEKPVLNADFDGKSPLKNAILKQDDKGAWQIVDASGKQIATVKENLVTEALFQNAAPKKYEELLNEKKLQNPLAEKAKAVAQGSIPIVGEGITMNANINTNTTSTTYNPDFAGKNSGLKIFG